MGRLSELAESLARPVPRTVCPKCGGTDTTMVVESFVETLPGHGPTCEASLRCRGCNNIVGWWAYGHWDPSYAMEQKLEQSRTYRVLVWAAHLGDSITWRIKWLTRKLKTWMAR